MYMYVEIFTVDKFHVFRKLVYIRKVKLQNFIGNWSVWSENKACCVVAKI